MKTMPKITDIKLDPIKIEVECHGENDYRMKAICQQAQFEDFNIDYDIQVYANNKSIQSIEVTEIQLWDDYENEFVKLSNSDYDYLAKHIAEVVEIENWAR